MNTHKIPALLSAALLSGGLSTGIALLIAGSLQAETAAPAPPTPAAPVGALPLTEIPFYAEWASSPHARKAAEPFNHWNKEGAVPIECARCHSTPGFHDYLGADGTAAGVVDHPAPIGTVIT